MTAQRVLMTAGAGGIGRAIVEAFTVKGPKVFVCDIDSDGLATLEKDFPGGGTTLCDISSQADIEIMVALAAKTLSGLDALINNAGISGPTTYRACRETRPGCSAQWMAHTSRKYWRVVRK